MPAYYSTFISGFGELITPQLRASAADCEITAVLDGLVVYRCGAGPREIAGLRFFNNSFLLLKQFPALSERPFEEMFAWALQSRELERGIADFLRSRPASLRVIVSRENRLESFDAHSIERLERKICAIKGARIDRGRPDYELWFLCRREGLGLIG